MTGFAETVGVKVRKFVSCVARAKDQVGNFDKGESTLATIIEKYKKRAKEARSHE